ncbi:MAG: small subunit of carbamoyl-phosphate synthase [Piptocephalis tieghemiana]|nr:MAG: small subunit of carbamoyl-phosphate synthase [Piptocephalis tieghemiana]
MAARGLPSLLRTLATSGPSASALERVKATLQLTSGETFVGRSFGAKVSAQGETVFTTALVGYPESMTDPSYRGQILVFTQPLVGNYGVPGAVKDEYGLYRYFESEGIQVAGIIVADYAEQYSHWTAVESLGEWCRRSGVPAITGVDTRAIVTLLRSQGSTLGEIRVAGGSEGAEKKKVEGEQQVYDPNVDNLVAQVSTREVQTYNPGGDVRIAVVDCGVKQNIIRSLVRRGATVDLMPWDTDVNEVAYQYDGIFYTNGPGNPEMASKAVTHLRTLLTHYQRPVFGICMGNQLLGQAAGLPIVKLPFGNRGHNQPALELQTGKCVITSQNHGYALDDSGELPAGWSRYFVNANDGSNEGIKHENGLWRSVQFHPEAKGGPMDTEYLFGEFLDSCRAEQAKRAGQSSEAVVADATTAEAASLAAL